VIDAVDGPALDLRRWLAPRVRSAAPLVPMQPLTLMHDHEVKE
jgi:hypothetical protein